MTREGRDGGREGGRERDAVLREAAVLSISTSFGESGQRERVCVDYEGQRLWGEVT